MSSMSDNLKDPFTTTTEVCINLRQFTFLWALALLGYVFLVTSCYTVYLVRKTHAKIDKLEGQINRLLEINHLLEVGADNRDKETRKTV